MLRLVLGTQTFRFYIMTSNKIKHQLYRKIKTYIAHGVLNLNKTIINLKMYNVMHTIET